METTARHRQRMTWPAGVETKMKVLMLPMTWWVLDLMFRRRVRPANLVQPFQLI